MMWTLAVSLCVCQPISVRAADRKVVLFVHESLAPIGATPTAAMTEWCTLNYCSPAPTSHIVVGERVDINITGAHLTSNGNVTLAVLSDPGMPSGCHVTASETHGIGSVNAEMKRLSFMPIAGQEGILYKVCIKASDANLPSDNVTYCFALNVHAPVVAFKSETALTVERTVGVNCPVLLTLLPYDESDQGYCMEMFAGKNNDASAALPSGAQLTHVGTESRNKRGSHDGCAHNEWLLAWYPVRGQEPHTYTYCVHARDTACMGYRCAQRGRDICFTVHVVKCKYCLSIGETIMHAAARYKSDWLQIWGANPHIVSPDSIPAWTSLQLGPMYSVRAGDTLENIARRFGTSSNNLLEANPDIQVVNDQGMINMGDELCVLPYVCTLEQMSSGGGAYRALD